MPFLFSLPTTSGYSFSPALRSETHPSLIRAATTRRNVVRDTLKKYKNLSISARPTYLGSIISALQDYLPYLYALEAGLGKRQVANEDVDVILAQEVETEWRPSLSKSPPAAPGREIARVKGRGLHFELCFVLTTLAYTYTLLARTKLHILFAPVTPSTEQRTAVIIAATKYLLEANSLHLHITIRVQDAHLPSTAIDIESRTQSALESLALCEATLLTVLKDDPYPGIVTQDRNNNDKEWMIKAPEIPKVRAFLFARLCLGAARHAGTAHALLTDLGDAKRNAVVDSLVKYTYDIQQVSRAKAWRFLGIDAELGGETGKAIAYLNGGKKELGYKVNEEESTKVKGFAKLKKGWSERKEDKKIEKGGEWGSDAGRLEEIRVIEMLEKKWNKANDLINSQLIPPSYQLISGMPSGRDIHTPKGFKRPELDADTLAMMRAIPDQDDVIKTEAESNQSSDEDQVSPAGLPGTFPASSEAGSTTYF